MREPKIQLPLRLPADVKAWVEAEASNNASSQNSEIVRALREAMRGTNHRNNP